MKRKDLEYPKIEDLPHREDTEFTRVSESLEFAVPEDETEYVQCSPSAEFVTPDSDAEFTPVGSTAEENQNTKKKRRLTRRLAYAFSSVAVVSIPVLNTVLPSSEIPEKPSDPEVIVTEPDPEPTAEPTPSGPVEYSIIGLWKNESGDYCRFMEDGSGYYYNGDVYSPLSWEKEGNDYRLKGEGVLHYGGDYNLTTFEMDSVTSWAGDGIYLYTEWTHSMDLYKPCNETLDDSFALSRFTMPIEERLAGSWLYAETLHPSPDVSDLKPVVYDLSEGQMWCIIGSESYGVQKEYTGELHNMGKYYWYESTGDFQIELRSGNNTFTYINDRFEFYYFVRGDGEYILVDPFSGVHLMKKFEE